MRSIENTPPTSGLLRIVSAKKIISTLLVILTILTLSSCSSYRSSIAWSTENEPATCHTFPIYKLGKLILIKGEVNAVRGYFIFDTGAPGLVNEVLLKKFEPDTSNYLLRKENAYFRNNRKVLLIRLQKSEINNLNNISEEHITYESIRLEFSLQSKEEFYDNRRKMLMQEQLNAEERIKHDSLNYYRTYKDL